MRVNTALQGLMALCVDVIRQLKLVRSVLQPLNASLNIVRHMHASLALRNKAKGRRSNLASVAVEEEHIIQRNACCRHQRQRARRAARVVGSIHGTTAHISSKSSGVDGNDIVGVHLSVAVHVDAAARNLAEAGRAARSNARRVTRNKAGRRQVGVLHKV